MKVMIALSLVLSLAPAAIAHEGHGHDHGKPHHANAAPPAKKADLKAYDLNHDGKVNGHDWIALSKAADTRYGTFLKALQTHCPHAQGAQGASEIAGRLNHFYATKANMGVPVTEAVHKKAPAKK